MTFAALALLPAAFVVGFIAWSEWRWRAVEAADDARIAEFMATRKGRAGDDEVLLK